MTEAGAKDRQWRRPCELDDLRRATILAEVQRDIAAADAYAAEHGSFSEFLRQHYREEDSA